MPTATAPAPLPANDDRPIPAGRAIVVMSPDLTRAEAAEHCACWTFREMYHRGTFSWLDDWEAAMHALCTLAPADPGDGGDPHDATHTIAAIRVEWDKRTGTVTRSDPDGTMRPAGRKGSAAWDACNTEARARLRATYDTLASEYTAPSPEEETTRRARALLAGTGDLAASAVTASAADVLAALELGDLQTDATDRAYGNGPNLTGDSATLIGIAYLLARVARLEGLSQAERAIVRRLSALLG
jgi:hypothetical protein